MIMIAGIDSLATQIYIQLFAASGFRISISVILLPIFLYFYEEINPVIQAVFIMTVGLTLRSFMGSVEAGGLWNSMILEAPTMIFDISYGLIYYIFYSRAQNKSLNLWFLVILFNDFFSNILELSLRSQTVEPVLQSVATLLLIASIRSVIAIVLIFFLKYYKHLLKKQEHEERYRSLLMLTSELNSELYMMSNNMAHIELVMTNAYGLYECLGVENAVQKRMALDIATDIHEIKKQYIHVMKGLEGITGEKPTYTNMHLKDLVNVLEHCFRNALGPSQDITLSFKCRSNPMINKHFLLMSVLRNLLGNALESVSTKGNGVIELEEYTDQDNYYFSVRDNGQGIKEKDYPFIFKPGFSTKFNENTGDINRGVGLTLTKEIVETSYKGSIDVTSTWGLGAKFTVVIPRIELEG
jgi:two-component system sensor histidine kinase YcbA